MVAHFWKCALQVNPCSYLGRYRGQAHNFDEGAYNEKLAEMAIANGVKVIGIADHADVSHVASMRAALQARGLVVFPGFEIASSEGIHFVCLWPEETSVDSLQRFLGALNFINEGDTTARSRLSAVELIEKVVDDCGGFVFAAHAVDAGGVLRLHCPAAWRSRHLKAVQIPGSLEELRENGETNSYFRILKGRDPEYARQSPIGVINAKDVAVPEDLGDPVCSCLVKMTTPCFPSFKEAFCDPEARVRLNSDVWDEHYPYLEAAKFIGGYLDGIHIQFSQNLNAVIGGRGTGKSTLIECLRYALESRPFGREAERLSSEIVGANLGRERGTVVVSLRSSRPAGRKFTITKQYGGSPHVTDEAGAASSFSPGDLIPDIKILGQNEILEIARDPDAMKRLVLKAMSSGKPLASGGEAKQIRERLARNRGKLCRALDELASLETTFSELRKCKEEFAQFERSGINDRLKIVQDVERARSLLERIPRDAFQNLDRAFGEVEGAIPDLAFLDDAHLPRQIGEEAFPAIRDILLRLSGDVKSLLNEWRKRRSTASQGIQGHCGSILSRIKTEEDGLQKVIAGLADYEGMSGRQLGTAYQNLVRKMALCKPAGQELVNKRKQIAALRQERRSILRERAQAGAEARAGREHALKGLNRRLNGKLKIRYDGPLLDQSEVVDFLRACDLENVSSGKRLEWIRRAEDFSAEKLADCIRRDQKGEDGFGGTGWNVTPMVRASLSKMTEARLLELEEIDAGDRLVVELNVSGGEEPLFKPIGELSTGQQCTAVLHLLLLETNAPLIMDQPEDNLDNAFIAESIVRQLREAKLSRQFIFATHNANIPVFGDAEWIGVMKAADGKASMPPASQGAIDVKSIKEDAADILEGGRAAFNRRKEKYGF